VTPAGAEGAGVEHSLEITMVQDREAIVFRLVGDLDTAGGPHLLGAVREAERDEGDPLVLDMQGVDFVDSSGVATLLELQQTAANCNRVVLLNPSSRTVKVLELGGVIQLFEVRNEASLAARTRGRP
jgi:anti-sigma B factor antagonist